MGPRRRSVLVALGVVTTVLVVMVTLVGVRARRQDQAREAGTFGTSTVAFGPTATVTSAAPGEPGAPGAPGPLAPGASGPEDAATPAPGPSPAVPGSSPNGLAPPPAGPGRMRLGGDDLGLTRVGVPSREAVAAVTRALGPPLADPASDSACIGAEEETTWEGFRLATSGGRISGWLSTGPALSTLAGATVGTKVAGLREAYGASLQVRPPAEPDAVPVFAVDGAGVGGTLTGSGPADTVTSIFNGTCESA